MKGILIDVQKKEVREVEWNDYKDIYRLLGCELFEIVQIDGGNFVYVDEEGLLNLNPSSMFFDMGLHQPFVGNGLVTGLNYDTGETIEPTMTVEEVRNVVKFMNISEVWSKLK